MIPLNKELLSALKKEHARRNPAPTDIVLINRIEGHRVTKQTIDYQLKRLANVHGWRTFMHTDSVTHLPWMPY